MDIEFSCDSEFAVRFEIYFKTLCDPISLKSPYKRGFILRPMISRVAFLRALDVAV